MKNLLTLLLLTILAYTGKAQTKAVTESGDEVILYENGTWKYTKDKHGDSSPPGDSAIAVSKVHYEKNKEASFLVKSKLPGIGINIDPHEWIFEKSTDNSDIEFRFKTREKEGYGMFISEPTEIPLENMPYVVITNARKKAPDAEIVKQEYRMVNGVKILFIEFRGTAVGIKFVWRGYYYSGSMGTIQLVTYTSQQLLNESRQSMENLLNGFALIAPPAK